MTCTCACHRRLPLDGADEAYAASCRPAWVAYCFGDRDPQVVAEAAAYARFFPQEVPA